MPSFRPKEHHVYDVLHCVKASFKKQALDEIKDYDCFNKEAFRLCVPKPKPSLPNAHAHDTTDSCHTQISRINILIRGISDPIIHALSVRFRVVR